MPKPSVSPDLTLEPQKAIPFGGSTQAQTLAASRSIQLANQAAKNLELGVQPANARNLNVQSVMAESQSLDVEPKAMQVSLRKTFHMPNGGGHNSGANHYATLNGEQMGAGGKLNQSVIVASEKQKGKLHDSFLANSTKKEGPHHQRKSIQSIVNQTFDDNVVIANSESHFGANAMQHKLAGRTNYLKHTTKSP